MVQLIVFDLEYGQPAASSPLPASRAPLDDLLGCYGHAGWLPFGLALARNFAWSGGCAGCHLAIAAAMGFHRGVLNDMFPGSWCSGRQATEGGWHRCALLLAQARHGEGCLHCRLPDLGSCAALYDRRYNSIRSFLVRRLILGLPHRSPLHRDGSVSVWQRHARLLTYSCLGATKLMPAALKFGSGGCCQVGGCLAWESRWTGVQLLRHSLPILMALAGPVPHPTCSAHPASSHCWAVARPQRAAGRQRGG